MNTLQIEVSEYTVAFRTSRHFAHIYKTEIKELLHLGLKGTLIELAKRKDNQGYKHQAKSLINLALAA